MAPKKSRLERNQLKAQKAQRKKDFEEKNSTNDGNSSAPTQVSVTADDTSIASETTTPPLSLAVSKPCRDAKQSEEFAERNNSTDGGNSSAQTQISVTADDISIASETTTPPLSLAVPEQRPDGNQSDAAHLGLIPDDSITTKPSLSPAVAEQLDDESWSDSMDCGLDPDDGETATPPRDEAFPGFGGRAMPGVFPFTFESARKLPVDYTTELVGESWLAWVFDFLTFPLKVVAGRKRTAAEMEEYEEAAVVPRRTAQNLTGNPGVLPGAEMAPRKAPHPTNYNYSHGKPPTRHVINPVGKPFVLTDHKQELARRIDAAAQAKRHEEEKLRLHKVEQREIFRIGALYQEYHIKSYDPDMVEKKYESFKRRFQSVHFKEEELRYLFECLQNQAPIQIPLTQETYQRGIELCGNQTLKEMEPRLYDFISRWVAEVNSLEHRLSLQAAEQTRQVPKRASATPTPLAHNVADQSAESAIVPKARAKKAAGNTSTIPALPPRARHYIPRAAVLASAAAAVQKRDAAEDSLALNDDEDDQAGESVDVARGADEYEAETDNPPAQPAAAAAAVENVSAAAVEQDEDDGDDDDDEDEDGELSPQDLLNEARVAERHAAEMKAEGDMEQYGFFLTDRNDFLADMAKIEDSQGSEEVKKFLNEVDPLGEGGMTRRAGVASRAPSSDGA